MSLVHRNLAFSISVSSQVHFVRKKIRKLSVIATKEEKSGPLSPPKRGQVHDQYHLFFLSFLFKRLFGDSIIGIRHEVSPESIRLTTVILFLNCSNGSNHFGGTLGCIMVWSGSKSVVTLDQNFDPSLLSSCFLRRPQKLTKSSPSI